MNALLINKIIFQHSDWSKIKIHINVHKALLSTELLTSFSNMRTLNIKKKGGIERVDG